MRSAAADPVFQVRGAHLKKNCAERKQARRVKNHDFKPKNHMFSNFRGGAPNAPPASAPGLPCTRPTR